MGEASPGWRSTTLDTDPVAERTHTALEDWFAKAAIFAATSCTNGDCQKEQLTGMLHFLETSRAQQSAAKQQYALPAHL